MSKKKLIELEIERGEPQLTKHFERWVVKNSGGKLRAFKDDDPMGARPDLRECDVQRLGKKTVQYWGGTHTFESVDVAARSHEEALEAGAALMGVKYWPFDPKKVAKFYSGNWRIVDVSKEKDRSILYSLSLGSRPKGFLIVGNGRTAGLLFQTKAQALNHLLLLEGNLDSLKKKKMELAAVNARVPKELKERADAALKALNISYVDLITHALNLAISEAEKAKPTKTEMSAETKKRTFEAALENAIEMLNACTDLEPTSGIKQAGSDAGIKFGDEMREFVEYANARIFGKK